MNTADHAAQKIVELETEIIALRERIRSLEEGAGIAAEQWVTELVGSTYFAPEYSEFFPGPLLP